MYKQEGKTKVVSGVSKVTSSVTKPKNIISRMCLTPHDCTRPHRTQVQLHKDRA